MSDVRSRKWCLITYLDLSKIGRIIETNNNIRNFAYILHDKDKNDVGEYKEKHVHIVLYLYNAVTLRQVKLWFKGYDALGREVNTLGERVHSTTNILEYLTHKNNPEKYQYSIDEVISNGLDDMLNRPVDEDKSYEIINSMLHHCPTLELVKRYGKDFIYHYNSYKMVVTDIKREYDYTMQSTFGFITKNEIDGLPYYDKEK